MVAVGVVGGSGGLVGRDICAIVHLNASTRSGSALYSIARGTVVGRVRWAAINRIFLAVTRSTIPVRYHNLYRGVRVSSPSDGRTGN